MKTITRKSMLYKTGVEYGDYTMNHVLGCFHGCKYPCYAYLMAKRFGNVKTYEEWCEPRLVSNTLALLDKELPKLKEKIKSVQLCFTTDPFMENYPEVGAMSIESIKKINEAGIPCTVLTKGLLPMKLKVFSKENEYGITLVSLDENFRKEKEPNSVSYIRRINALRKLHEAGCKTWVSIEPYPTPNIIEQKLEEILKTVSFVDKIIFGRTHYNKIISEYNGYKSFYNSEAEKVIDFCKSREIMCHIKKGTITE
ncbi:MAG: radical SAM protein [Treponemataceae bacterium]|nr:radical SAM protein [Treponemataceae bacterium]